jgi:lipoprotein-anchoring transpeptidase ErfK/SrfK
MLAVQVFLDRARFSPGEIDGKAGANTARAIEAYERVNTMSVADAVAAGGAPPTVAYTISPDDAAGPYGEIPADMMAKAALKRLTFASLPEALGERFHASPALLQRLNPSARFVAGETIQVPNIATLPAQPPSAALTLTVSKSRSVLTLSDDSGAVVYHAPVSSGSEHDPLPLGEWTVTAVAKEPPFHYNPDLFWDADPTHAKATIPPGPNNPVGVVWIDLSKPHYGIHGTPEPGSVGHTATHGCVRLTHWDAAAVAGMWAKGTKVVFVE